MVASASRNDGSGGRRSEMSASGWRAGGEGSLGWAEVGGTVWGSYWTMTSPTESQCVRHLLASGSLEEDREKKEEWSLSLRDEDESFRCRRRGRSCEGRLLTAKWVRLGFLWTSAVTKMSTGPSRESHEEKAARLRGSCLVGGARLWWRRRCCRRARRVCKRRDAARSWLSTSRSAPGTSVIEVMLS